MENQDKKRVLIIEAAVKRFAHFGLAKTTMTDIAKDLSLSKALLYYYFPDKLSLYVSVIEYIIQQIGSQIAKSIQNISSSKEAILASLEKRHAFIQKYYHILEYTQRLGPDLPPDILAKFNAARDFELKLIQSLFEKGVDTGELVMDDPALTAELFVNALFGLKYNIIQHCSNFFPSKADFNSILNKEKKFAEIFIHGLSVR